VGILSATLKVLKFPLKLLSGLVGSQRKKPKRSEREQKQINHVRNFDSTRLKNKSWQKRAGKKLTKKQKNHYQKKRNKTKIII